MARIPDISGEVLAGKCGARVVITYLDGRAPVEMDVTDQEAAEILAHRQGGGGRLRKLGLFPPAG